MGRSGVEPSYCEAADGFEPAVGVVSVEAVPGIEDGDLSVQADGEPAPVLASQRGRVLKAIDARRVRGEQQQDRCVPGCELVAMGPCRTAAESGGDLIVQGSLIETPGWRRMLSLKATSAAARLRRD